MSSRLLSTFRRLHDQYCVFTVFYSHAESAYQVTHFFRVCVSCRVVNINIIVNTHDFCILSLYPKVSLLPVININPKRSTLNQIGSMTNYLLPPFISTNFTGNRCFIPLTLIIEIFEKYFSFFRQVHRIYYYRNFLGIL